MDTTYGAITSGYNVGVKKMNAVDPFYMVERFMTEVGHLPPYNDNAVDYSELVDEEYGELTDVWWSDVDSSDPISAADELKEICDLIYVLIGCALQQGYDIAGAFAEVHHSNMSKRVNGKFWHDHTGKVIKGSGYKAPDMRPYVGRDSDVE